MAYDDRTRPPADPAARGADSDGLQWVPIRPLAERHRPRILAHLLALAPTDRYLRFGHQPSDAQIGRYVDLLDFERDDVFGIFNRRLELVAMAHLANLDGSKSARAAEFGVSVLPRQRGRGLGGRLFQRAVLHASNRRIDTLVVHALSENTAMLRIARHAGAVVERDGPDSQAVLKLPPQSLASQVEEIVATRVAEFDYGWKRRAFRVDQWLDALSDVNEGSGRSGGPGLAAGTPAAAPPKPCAAPE
ncbi:MAG: GNAT family N-acetyltransferase [Rubrivivax sp.]